MNMRHKHKETLIYFKVQLVWCFGWWLEEKIFDVNNKQSKNCRIYQMVMINFVRDVLLFDCKW